ncbi:precorrin-2 C(20)-methyltransferase [Devosia sediminis]|uniref:precorrin-2 C(20)-methyltransferase n=1 Tax=Devosia sediminis TaxID=2798801 RepID=UPI002E293E23|nr:precorrin-2 C(20)-methyltransferase [Devosia sediminis]
MSGKLIGVGTGPGDPELLTLKAVRAITGADVVACFAKRGNPSNARAIVAQHLRPGQIEEALDYPVTTEIHRHAGDYKTQIQAFYDEAAERLAAHLGAGRTVAVLSEGDPLLYGSYMHLHVRLAPRFETEVIPGISAMSGCWSAAGLPLVQGDDVLTILPGTLDEPELTRRLADTQGAVIMKLGRNLPKVRAALANAGRLDGALYVERGTMNNASTMALSRKVDDAAPYFSLVLVPGWSARP